MPQVFFDLRFGRGPVESRGYYYFYIPFRRALLFQPLENRGKHFFEMGVPRKIRYCDNGLHSGKYYLNSSFGNMLSRPSMHEGSRDFFSIAISSRFFLPYIASRKACFSLPMPCSAETVPFKLMAFLTKSI